MTLWLITLLFLLGASLQTLLPTVGFLGALDWPLLTGLLIFIVLHSSRERGVYASVLASLLYDSFSLAPLGLSLPFFVLLGLGVLALREIVVKNQVVTYFILGLFAVFFKTVYFAAILSLSGLRPLEPGLLSVRLFGSLALGILTVPMVYFLLRYLQRMLPQIGRWD